MVDRLIVVPLYAAFLLDIVARSGLEVLVRDRRR